MITLKNVSKTFHGAAARSVHAVRDVSLTIEAGEIFGVIGRSGGNDAPATGTGLVKNQHRRGTNSGGARGYNAASAAL